MDARAFRLEFVPTPVRSAPGERSLGSDSRFPVCRRRWLVGEVEYSGQRRRYSPIQ